MSIEKVESLVRERVIKELATHKNERALEQLWGSMGGGKGMDREMFGSVLEDLGMGGKFQSEEIDTLFNALDRDGSGKISLDEVEDFVQMKRKGEASK